MGLPEELLRGIFSYGFEKPSAIQQRAIKPVMLGRDLIAQAQSGTVRNQFSHVLAYTMYRSMFYREVGTPTRYCTYYHR